MRYGGGGELTRITYCGVRFDHQTALRLIELLPDVLQVDTWDHEDSWLQSTVRFISREAGQMRPGGETIITRLADIIVIQAIRSWIDSAPESNQGWLAALRDGSVGPAIVAIHREPKRDWTVASLAKEVGMSRSGVSVRFTDLVGESAMNYLTQWRMQLARTQLIETSEPLSAIAVSVGYQSEAAFGRAFKRVLGVPPGSVRHSETNSPSV
jgi:AraC-like DNA-binding protein